MTNPISSGAPAMERPPDHWIGALGLDLEVREPEVTVRCEVQPGMRSPATGGVRMGILVTIADMAGGHVPKGPTNPTVDLRTQLTARAPRTGSMVCTARPLRVGRRLIVSEMEICDDTGRPFAVARSTFMNQPMGLEDNPGDRQAPVGIDSFEKLIGAQAIDEATIEVAHTPKLSNGTTIQGGAQAFIAELAAERLFPPRTAYVTDLHIDYLNAVRVGPLRARAEILGAAGNLVSARVRLTDRGNDHKIVSHVTLWLREEEPLP